MYKRSGSRHVIHVCKVAYPGNRFDYKVQLSGSPSTHYCSSLEAAALQSAELAKKIGVDTRFDYEASTMKDQTSTEHEILLGLTPLEQKDFSESYRINYRKISQNYR